MQTDFQRLESELDRLGTENTNTQFFVPRNEWKLQAESLERWLELQNSQSLGQH